MFEDEPHSLRAFSLNRCTRALGHAPVDGEVVKEKFNALPMFIDPMNPSDTDVPDDDDALDYYDGRDGRSEEDIDYGHVGNDHVIENRQQNNEIAKRTAQAPKSLAT